MILFVVFVLLETITGLQMGGIKTITPDSNPTLWYRARDVALMIKQDALSQINNNSFGLKADSQMYSFSLSALGLQVTNISILYHSVNDKNKNMHEQMMKFLMQNDNQTKKQI